ncbi:MAG: phosphotransferase family protein [Acidimicrobiales bacterium]|nr:phosphotransferase family protein [Acidimicrobiaceae bacterium]MXX43543.1 phosphotransferase family protein [Acidimicrobiales bacterium]MCY3607137.1 phosphotransferase family protein [Acidimicrobiaceae bacterium]MDE0675774.1 phosphotransferase family protein [Acidimicrobiaceae bacterium]MXZ14460.1 phosphotransferase family protein [Acidimicrobiales bacterium]
MSTAEQAAPDHEQFAATLSSYLADRLGTTGPVKIRDMERIAVGWSHETWLFDAVWSSNGSEQRMGLCLRRDPGNALLRDKSDLGEQFRVLQCLGDTEVPAPRAYWHQPDPDVLGAPALIMEKVPGVCPSPWRRAGRDFYAAAAARGVLPASFTDALAAVHNVDWRSAGLDFLGVPEAGKDFAHREIDKWESLIEASGHEGHPILSDLIGWLRHNAPPAERLTLVHGAFRTGNLLIDDDRISAVLDWELQVIGDPMYDVAYVLTELNREGTDLLSNVVPRELFFERYQRATGIEIDEQRCAYYQLLYAMRSAAFWMSAAGLYADGATTDLRLARTHWSVTVALERAATELGY